MNHAVFGKAMENMRKHRDIKFDTTERRKNHLVSESNYHNTKFLTNYLSAWMKDKWGRQIMKEFVGLRAKAYSYLKCNNDKNKKAKGTNVYVIKRIF